MLWILLAGAGLAVAGPQDDAIDEHVRTMIAERVAEIRVEQLAIEVELRAWESQLADGKTVEVATALQRPSLDEWLRQRGRAAMELSDLAQRYGEQHPELIAARSRVVTVESGLREEVKLVLQSERLRIEVLQTAEKDLLAATP